MPIDERRKTMIETLERTPSRVASLVEGMATNDLVMKPSDHVFSIRETIHHLRDIEVEGYAVRLTHMLQSERPFLPDIDGDRLAVERRYNDRPHEEPLAEFDRARRACIARLRGMPAESWSKTGELEGVGDLTIERLVEMWSTHDTGHLADIERLRGVRGSRSRE